MRNEITPLVREEIKQLLVARAQGAITGAIASLERAALFLEDDDPKLVEAWNAADVALDRIKGVLYKMERALALVGPVAGPPGASPMMRIEEFALNSRAGS